MGLIWMCKTFWKWLEIWEITLKIILGKDLTFLGSAFVIQSGPPSRTKSRPTNKTNKMTFRLRSRTALDAYLSIKDTLTRCCTQPSSQIRSSSRLSNPGIILINQRPRNYTIETQMTWCFKQKSMWGRFKRSNRWQLIWASFHFHSIKPLIWWILSAKHYCLNLIRIRIGSSKGLSVI